jgi:hypothetical protein
VVGEKEEARRRCAANRRGAKKVCNEKEGADNSAVRNRCAAM